jgi:hypothetical protein
MILRLVTFCYCSENHINTQSRCYALFVFCKIIKPKNLNDVKVGTEFQFWYTRRKWRIFQEKASLYNCRTEPISSRPFGSHSLYSASSIKNIIPIYFYSLYTNAPIEGKETDILYLSQLHIIILSGPTDRIHEIQVYSFPQNIKNPRNQCSTVSLIRALICRQLEHLAGIYVIIF